MHQPKARDETGRRVLALGLVAAATLMLQIIETRIISVISWYHLAFFVISIAMFGLTARSEEHTSELQSHRDLHSFPTRRSSDLATLMLQIIETRIISVISWYHLAFFVISIAMFGLTAGAVFVYLWRERFGPDRLSSHRT